MHRSVRYLSRALAAVVCGASLAAPASAQVRIQATSITSGNVLMYSGLGSIGAGVGHGVYQLGSCAVDGGTRTSCTTTGSYLETAGSVNPGSTGTFIWSMSWAGTGPNPIEARSISAGNNELQLYVVPPGAYFELFLSNGLYANLDFGAQDTPNPTGGVLNWQGIGSTDAQCTGGPAICSIGSVGLTNGANLTSTIAAFTLQLDYPTGVPTSTPTSTVPEPASIVLLATGLAFVGAKRYRRGRGEA